MDIVAGSDGDGIHDFETEPADVESPSHVIYPACVTIAGLVTSTSTPASTQTLSAIHAAALEFLPQDGNCSFS